MRSTRSSAATPAPTRATPARTAAAARGPARARARAPGTAVGRRAEQDLKDALAAAQAAITASQKALAANDFAAYGVAQKALTEAVKKAVAAQVRIDAELAKAGRRLGADPEPVRLGEPPPRAADRLHRAGAPNLRWQVTHPTGSLAQRNFGRSAARTRSTTAAGRRVEVVPGEPQDGVARGDEVVLPGPVALERLTRAVRRRSRPPRSTTRAAANSTSTTAMTRPATATGALARQPVMPLPGGASCSRSSAALKEPAALAASESRSWPVAVTAAGCRARSRSRSPAVMSRRVTKPGQQRAGLVPAADAQAGPRRSAAQS